MNSRPFDFSSPIAELHQGNQRLFRHCLRGCDYAAHYGGDEFTVLLPNTTLETAELVAQRIKETLVENGFIYHDNVINTNFSILN